MHNNPEHLIAEINSAALTALKMSHSLPDSEDLIEARTHLKDGLRQTVVAQMLADHFCIAVCGIQGVGKSTFISALYDLDTILPQNLGQGELLPVLISEDKTIINEPLAVVRRLTRDQITEEIKVEDVPEKIDEVWKRSRKPEPDDLLINLKVRPRYDFPQGSGFLLLPGWQPDIHSLEQYHSLTQIALLSAARCLFVIDPSQTADKRQHDLDQKIKETFKDSDYFVALTHSDTYPDGNAANREDIAERFGISQERIFCVGTFADSGANDEWRKSVVRRVLSWGQSSASHRALRLRRLKGSLEKIRSAHGPIQRSLRRADAQYLTQEDAFKSHIKKFDRSIHLLRKCMDKHAKAALEKRANRAIEILNSHYQDKVLWSRMWEGIGDFFRGGPDVKAFFDRAKQAWENCNANDPSTDRLHILNGVVTERLGIHGGVWPSANSELTINEQAKLSLNPPAELGSIASERLTYTDPDTAQKSTLAAIYWLSKPPHLSSAQIPGKGLEYALEMLPILAVEYQRQLIACNGLLGISPDKENAAILFEDLNPKLADVLRECGAGFPQGDSVKLLFSSMAAMLGLDGAIDGNIDSLASLAASLHAMATTTSTAATTTTVATSTAALSTQVLFGAVAIIGLAKTFNLIATDLYRSNTAQNDAANTIIRNLASRIHAAYLTEFDSIMERLREVIERRIEEKCGLPSHRSRQLNAVLAMDRLHNLCGAAIGDIDASVSGLHGR